MRTALTRLLGITHPVLLAPMGGVSGGELARAVSEAGGLGLIGAGYGDADWLAQEMAHCRDCRFGGASSPGPWTPSLRCSNRCWRNRRRPSCSRLAIALPIFPACTKPASWRYARCRPWPMRAPAEIGADLIVAQGTEGGGHGATRSTFSLVPAVVDAVVRCRSSRLVAWPMAVGWRLHLCSALPACSWAPGSMPATKRWAWRPPNRQSCITAVTRRCARASSISCAATIGAPIPAG